jgi:hypothetical protein
MEKKFKTLLAKLQRPIHYSYISKYILKESDEKTLEYLSSLIKDGLVKEHDFSGYYVATNYDSID